MCEFCEDILSNGERYEKVSCDGKLKIVTHKITVFSLEIDGSDGLFINFCPICSRDLRSEENE